MKKIFILLLGFFTATFAYSQQETLTLKSVNGTGNTAAPLLLFKDANNGLIGSLGYSSTSNSLLYLSNFLSDGIYVNSNLGIHTVPGTATLSLKTLTPTTGLYETQSWQSSFTNYNLSLKTSWGSNGINYRFVQNFNGTEHNSLTFYAGNVGIGTTSPDLPFHVAGTTGNHRIAIGETGVGRKVLYLGYNFSSNAGEIQAADEGYAFKSLLLNPHGGNVGIGTATPGEKLEVNGNIKGPGAESTIKNFKGIIGRSSDGILHLRAGTPTGSVFVNHYESGNIIMANGGGKIGIGTTTPGEKLEVAGNALISGKIYTSKIEVSTTPGNWPDYVFEKEYTLPSLNEVEQFINTNKHLPEVPSAKEVEKNGQDLGDIQATLLKKVEELTLYLIEQDKKQLSMEERLKKLEAENAKLKALLKQE